MLYITIATFEPNQRNEIVERRLEKGAMIPDKVIDLRQSRRLDL